MPQIPPKRRRHATLPEDLISEILLRLPAKSVGRFRCVCKLWVSLTSDPRFIADHASRSPISGLFLVPVNRFQPDHMLHTPFDAYDADGESRLRDPSLSFLDHEGLPPEFIDSRNGLVLLSKPYRLSSSKQAAAGRSVAVCNPITRAHHLIPLPKSVPARFLRLAFDPSRSPHFKIAGGVHGSFGEGIRRIYIYSSETQMWSFLQFQHQDPFFFFRSLLWNGNLVLDSYKGSPILSLDLGTHYKGSSILSLDLGTQELRSLPSPAGEEGYRVRYLGESGGRLHFIGEPQTVTDDSVTHFAVQEMKPDASGWFMLYEIDIDHIKDLYPEVNALVHSLYGSDLNVAVKIICFLRDEDGRGDRLMLSIPGKIVSCRLTDMSFTTLCSNLHGDHVWTLEDSFHPHVHTLFPLESTRVDSRLHQEWVCWTSEKDRLLMDLMVDHSLKGKKAAFGFNLRAWHDMAEKLNVNGQRQYNVNNLKDRLLSYKRDYDAVKKILSLRGFSWDPTLQMVIAGDDQWTRYLESKGNCYAALFRRRQVPLKDLEIICASSKISFP